MLLPPGLLPKVLSLLGLGDEETVLSPLEFSDSAAGSGTLYLGTIASVIAITTIVFNNVTVNSRETKF